MLLTWWNEFIIDGGRTMKTGRNWLDALSGVFSYAMDAHAGMLHANPVDALRARLRKRGRTKAGRRAASTVKKATPIEGPVELDRFLRASPRYARDREDPEVHLIHLLLLDAGLREGEAFAIRWGRIWWGRDGSDPTRHLVVDEARVRGRHEGPPKSGRSRRVALSRRLRKALAERWLELGRPGAEVRIVKRADPNAFRRCHFARVCDLVEIARRRPKDLRDSFASHLLSVGVPLG